MMFQPIYFAAEPGAGNIRDRIQVLTEQLKAHPDNQAALLQLAQLYGQVWASTRRQDLPPRIVPCLQRAIALETGQHAGAIRQLLAGMGKQAQAFGDQDFLGKLKILNAQLNAKAAAAPPAASPPAAEPAPPPETPAAEPAVSPPGPAAVSPERLGPDALDIEVEVETVAEPAVEEKPAAPPRAAARPGQSAQDIRDMFEQENVDMILRTYVSMPPVHVRKQIIEGLVGRLSSWKIEPILAVAALETDEQVFRHIMRLLMKTDRAQLCEQIQLDKYSSDLRKVAVTFLGELGMRAALPKLEQALDLEDPLVRCVAANGIARFGKAALRYIPLLLRTLKSDPNAAVRLAAAKALGTMNVPEAYEAFEKEASESRLDPKVLEVLVDLRAKFGEEKEGKQKAGEKEKASLPKEVKQFLLLLVLIAGLLVAGYFAWSKIRDPFAHLPPPPVEESY